MDEDTKYFIDVNQANLERVIGFVGVMDAKAKFVLTLILALTGYLVTQLSSFIDAHTRINMMPPWAATLMILLDLAAGRPASHSSSPLPSSQFVRFDPPRSATPGKHPPSFFTRSRIHRTKRSSSR